MKIEKQEQPNYWLFNLPLKICFPSFFSLKTHLFICLKSHTENALSKVISHAQCWVSHKQVINYQLLANHIFNSAIR